MKETNFLGTNFHENIFSGHLFLTSKLNHTFIFVISQENMLSSSFNISWNGLKASSVFKHSLNRYYEKKNFVSEGDFEYFSRLGCGGFGQV